MPRLRETRTFPTGMLPVLAVLAGVLSGPSWPAQAAPPSSGSSAGTPVVPDPVADLAWLGGFLSGRPTDDEDRTTLSAALGEARQRNAAAVADLAPIIGRLRDAVRDAPPARRTELRRQVEASLWFGPRDPLVEALLATVRRRFALIAQNAATGFLVTEVDLAVYRDAVTFLAAELDIPADIGAHVAAAAADFARQAGRLPPEDVQALERQIVGWSALAARWSALAPAARRDLAHRAATAWRMQRDLDAVLGGVTRELEATNGSAGDLAAAARRFVDRQLAIANGNVTMHNWSMIDRALGN